MSQPILCRPAAFRLLERAAANIETNEGLFQAALAISIHELGRVDIDKIARTISGYAQRVRGGAPSGEPRALLAHLHCVLFEEEGFKGNSERYYEPSNSYLPTVLETKRGLPITLSLVYKLVAEEAGLSVFGVNAPGHFLALVNDDELLVDPFFGGQVLSKDEAFIRMEEASGQPLPRDERFLRPTTHRQWVLRMLYNLHNVFDARARKGDVAAMAELSSVLMHLSL